MAEKVVWNKSLLIASLVLGVLAVGLFYLYDSVQEKKIRGDIIEVLKWRQDFPAGEKITEDDVEVIRVPGGTASVEGVARKTHLDSIIVGGTLSRSVERDKWVFISDIIQSGARRPSADISKGRRSFTLKLDPDYTPGDLLRQGDRVDVLGLVSLRGKPPRTYVLVENLRILEVEGRTKNPGAGSEKKSSRPGGQRTIRRISVEVTPQVACDLNDLLKRISGSSLRVVVRNPTESSAADGKLTSMGEQALAMPARAGN